MFEVACNTGYKLHGVIDYRKTEWETFRINVVLSPHFTEKENQIL